MAITSNTYTGNGSNKLFSITFPYLDTTDIDVSINGTITTAYTFANATTIEFTTAPASGATVLIERITDDANLKAVFYPGSSVKAADLNDNFDQILYISQETANATANQSTAGLQDQITAATNTANTAATDAASATALASTAVQRAGDLLTGALGIVTGSSLAPGLYFSGDTDTGVYSPNTGQYGITINGTPKFFLSEAVAKFPVTGSNNFAISADSSSF
jgi:hypothetical protein